jgi:hypothetical protein
MTDVQYKVPVVSVKPKDLGNACHHFSTIFVLIFFFMSRVLEVQQELCDKEWINHHYLVPMPTAWSMQLSCPSPSFDNREYCPDGN